jgi:hypothetical protein
MFHLNGMIDHISPIARPSGLTSAEVEKTPVFLILESNFLIAEDLIGSLQSLGACRTIHVLDPRDAIRVAASEETLSAAFLEMRYSDVLAMGLDQIFDERGTLIILTAGRAEEHKVRSAGWGMLIRPFSENMIHEELKAVKS